MSQPTGPYSVSGVVVRTLPEALPDVRDRVSLLPGVDVHHEEAATGRMVVTLEAAGSDMERERLDRIRREPGVVSAELVYHYVEPPGADGTRTDAPESGEP